jgi:hypothetical protein
MNPYRKEFLKAYSAVRYAQRQNDCRRFRSGLESVANDCHIAKTWESGWDRALSGKFPGYMQRAKALGHIRVGFYPLELINLP